MKIEKSIILITGGASGIGETIAKYFSSLGGVVYICDLQNEKGEKVETESKGKIKFIQCDVSEENQVEAMINKIYQENGRIDIIINNAGIIGNFEPVDEEVSVHVKNFMKIYKSNLLGAFLVSKFGAKKMIEKFDPSKECNGNIINISSIMGLQGIKSLTSYSASKGALIGMMMPMARDLGKFKIRVNSVCPGLIQTPMVGAASFFFKSIARSTPINRLGLPFEIAQACESIIVNDFMNASVLKVDGGIISHF